MILKYLVKVIASTLMLASIFALNPIGASASWKQDNRGWWYTEDHSWITGWKIIEGKWYYFNSDGYMAHDTVIDGFKLGSDGAWINTQIAASSEEIVDVTVGTAEEFVNALGSNKRIILKPGVYNLSTINQVNKSDNSVTWETVQDGKELNLQNIHNLTIEGMDSGKVEIKVAPRFANILDKCVIKNNSQSTDANVLNDNVYFFNTTDYFGNSDSKITVKDSEISNNKCDYLLINKENVEFNNCTITNNTWK